MQKKDISTLRELFDYAVENYKDNKSLYFIDTDGYTYGQFGEKTIEVSNILAEYGIEAKDKVGILSQNMPNWGISFFAISGFGRISIPILPDFSESDIKHILKHSECKALFISKRLLPKLLDKAKDRLSLIVLLDDFSVIKGEKLEGQEIKEIPSEQIKTEDLTTIIYTSGTTGSSKGVMLTHKNLCVNLHNCEALRPSFSWDRWLSLLPLSHTFENSLSLLLPIFAGGSVCYIEKVPTPTVLMSALAKVKPTTVLSVPLIIEKIYKNGVESQLQKSPVSRFLMKIPATRKVLHRIAGKKLMEKFGGELRFFGIGGAKLNAKVERFLYEGKFPYAIGYGLTETSPLLAGATTDIVRIGSTGKAAASVTLKLRNVDPTTGLGEIIAKGDNIMQGYYKNPEATKEAFTEDGWFITRDLGSYDKDGMLYIKGRTNNTILGPSGENIYPEDIENVLNSHDFINESLITEEKGRLKALVHFNQEKLNAFFEAKDEFKQNATEKMEALKKEILEYVNQKVSRFAKISEILEQKEEFQKTATQKIKRFLYTQKGITEKN